MTLFEAVKTIKDYCAKKDMCYNCKFAKAGTVFPILCGLMRKVPENWEVPPEINIYDEEEIHENCTVQILKNSVTGEESIGWWENGKETGK